MEGSENEGVRWVGEVHRLRLRSRVGLDRGSGLILRRILHIW